MKRLLFMRHGESTANAESVYAGSRRDIQLTDLGRQQAHLAGKDLVGQGIDLIIASPFDRAVETAKIVAFEIGYPVTDIKTDDRLREISVGKLTGQPDQGFVKGFAYLAGGTDPEAETPAAVAARVTNALYDLEKSAPDKTVLIVAHAGVGRTCRAVLSRTTLGELADTMVPNAEAFDLPLGQIKEALG